MGDDEARFNEALALGLASQEVIEEVIEIRANVAERVGLVDQLRRRPDNGAHRETVERGHRHSRDARVHDDPVKNTPVLSVAEYLDHII